MKIPSRHPRLLIWLLCVGLILGVGGPMVLVPVGEAALSNAAERIVKRLKRKIKQLRRQLVIARAPKPPPPAQTMALISAGAFDMGDETGSSGGPGELPVHTVTVSAFYIDQFEVTKALWDAVSAWGAANGYDDLLPGAAEGAFHPVHSVDWYSVVKWCNARSEMEGLMPVYYTDATQTTVYRTGEIDLAETAANWAANGFRLPTEAEWEKAARGNVASMTYPWGNAIEGSDANYNGSGDPFDIGGVETTPTGFFDGGQLPAGVDRANGYFVYDMAGNLWEWTWDRHSNTYYASSPANDPRGPAAGGRRTLRGGSWSSPADSLRCARRNGFAGPAFVDNRTGFRSAANAP